MLIEFKLIEFKRLSEIDEKMLNNKNVTDEELKERTEIIQKFQQEIENEGVDINENRR